MRIVKQALIVAVLAATALALGGTPGQAEDPDHFEACGGPSGWACNESWSNGAISWSNRTAIVYAAVVCDTTSYSTTVSFDGYAGSNLIDRVTRTSRENCLALPNIAIGDPDLPGGINIVRVTVCTNSAPRRCGATVPVLRG